MADLYQWKSRESVEQIFRLLGVALLLVVAFPTVAHAQFTTASDGNGGLIITGYTGTPTSSLVIPGAIAGLTVSGIGDQAFTWLSTVTSVTIPNTVSSIGGTAFAYTGLISVTIPNSVTSIGGGAFADCSNLTTVSIPGNSTSIADSAFAFCPKLNNVTLGNGVTSIGDSAFNNDSSLTAITIPKSVTSIGSQVFGNCSSLSAITAANFRSLK